MSQLGTRWVALGEGHTIDELIRAAAASGHPTKPAVATGNNGQCRTNLQLLGVPLQAHDLSRIKAAEVSHDLDLSGREGRQL